jgi:signal recognition particle subunit SRP54
MAGRLSCDQVFVRLVSLCFFCRGQPNTVMFESLTDKLQGLFQRLNRKGRLGEADVAEAMREIRLALLEADVNFRVVKEFISRLQTQLVGENVLRGLNPTQHVVKVVHQELMALLGDNGGPLATAPKTPSVYVIVGLQGGGKTTTCGKLAALLKRQGQKPLLVATDVARPAAIQQLQVVGAGVGVPVFQMGTKLTPADIARAAYAEARAGGYTHVVVDTAGRLHVDEGLMGEVVAVREVVPPQEILLVLDAMTGQDAVNVAEQFNARLNLTGFILTKVDGDTRGGAALSVRQVTGKPIRFLGTGEKSDALEAFHPDRLASRILGMGDMLSLIERAEASIEIADAERLEERLRTQRFDLSDFGELLDQYSRMGLTPDQMLDMVPGMSQLKKMGPLEVDPRRMKRMRAILLSMTPAERARPDIIRGSRRRRIAAGSGTTIGDVNMLLKQFDQMQGMMGQMMAVQRGGGRGKTKMGFPFSLR